MTSDGTLYARDERASELDSSNNDSEWNVAAVQLTAADAARVTLPQGQRVVVVPVTPGERVELPTDSADGLLAELGAQGNLAIVVDGRTIILQGYAAANEESPVTIVTNDGDQVDVAFVLAETDPSLDIQTAAGPAAGSAGAGAEGGSGIFVPFPAGAPLGGFDGEGVLGATALQYKLIDNSAKIFDLDDDDEVGSGIENSLPEANPDSATVAQSVATDYQLMLVIDVSGSMAEEVARPDGTVTTRMELQKAAVIAMLESYAAATTGFVNIKMVQFSNDASYFGGTSASTFIDITDPANLAAVIAAINALGPTDNTDYDTALATAQQGIMDASWVAATPTTKGLVYFFSDGVPVNDGDAASSYPGGDKANAINDTEENVWEGRTPAAGFPTGLASKGVVSIAVGLGADVASDAAALAQLGRVAYHNESFKDDSVIVVSDENQLIAEIIQTVPATVTGNVLTNDDPGKDGFGSPVITAISAVADADTIPGAVTATATGYKVETSNGVLIIDKTTGDFSYTAAPGSTGHEDTFNYTIQDGFLGDTDSSTLTIAITPPTMVTGAAPFDADDGNNFIIGDDANNTINALGGIDSVQGGFGNDLVDGGAGNDALYGQEGKDTLLGGDGNDALFGGNLDDTLNGGAGIDALAGGVGNDLLDGGDDTETDILSGGIGNDTLIWRTAEDVYGGGAEVFDTKTGKAGDILDVSGSSSVDFTTVDDSKIDDVETVRMTGGAGTTVTIDVNDVINDFEGSAFNPDGAGPGGNYGKAPILRVDGDAGDTLNLSGGDWHAAAGSSGTPAGYTLYVHESGGGAPGSAEDAYVLVQNTVGVATV
jgi:Ca2+-binding RTX toxin-like protein